jgi:cellulose synthase/poly-beta-1,6-N-acetylglucosamine synthase-like glycosyltransferase
VSPLWAVIDGLMAASALLFGLRLVVLVLGSGWDVLHRWRHPTPDAPPGDAPWPALTVLVPAFNEERVLEGTVHSALASRYPTLSVMVIDDGSEDGTAALAQRLAVQDPRVRLIRQQPNQGKAAALNAGLAACETPLVVSLDADTVLLPDSLERLVVPLTRGADACSSNLEVGNKAGLLTRWQSVEYVLGLNLTRRAQASLGCITTIPGAAAAFRTEALRAVGGWSGDTRTEDTDLTLALLRAGHRVAYEPRARALTEAPETFGGLLRQRTRWMHGYLACILKHRRAFLRTDSLGWFGMPNLLLLHVLVFPLLLASLPYTWRVVEWTSPTAVLGFLLGYLWLDTLLATGCYLVDRKPIAEVALVPLWRLGWPFFLLLVFLRTWMRMLVAREVPWEKAERVGTLADGVTQGREP